MSRSDAFIRVMCDKCEVEMEVDLTALAGHGCWDERGVKGQLRRDGWTKDGELDLCDVCSPQAHTEGQ